MNKKIILAAFIVNTLAGCAVPKQMIPIGGSKADGTVRMSYTYKMFEQPVVDQKKSMEAAKARCSAWGFNAAEPFGGFTSQCSKPSSSGCAETTVTMEYQCTGDINK